MKLLTLALLLLTTTALATEPNGGRGAVDVVKLEELIAETGPNGGKGRKLKNALEGYFNSMLAGSITEPGHERVAELFTTRYPVKAILAEIGSRGAYANLDCRGEDGRQLEISARYSDPGGDICLNLPVIADRLRGKPLQESLIRFAALAFEGHLRHFQADPWNISVLTPLENHDLERRNRDEISLLVAYFIETARMTEYPLLKWEASSNGLAAEY
ncbi:MAG TPA: hypothetical protein VM598_14010 [Bdellovibrionota bacterium]|nr:hypothetical protein [Bdellovibrionota bacterium]